MKMAHQSNFHYVGSSYTLPTFLVIVLLLPITLNVTSLMADDIRKAFGIDLCSRYIPGTYDNKEEPRVNNSYFVEFLGIKPPAPNTDFSEYSIRTLDGRVMEIEAATPVFALNEKKPLCQNLIRYLDNKYGPHIEGISYGSYNWKKPIKDPNGWINYINIYLSCGEIVSGSPPSSVRIEYHALTCPKLPW